MTSPPPFLIAGHPAIDFVNSRATPEGMEIDWLADADSMMDWAAALGLFPAAELRELQRKTGPVRLAEIAKEMRELRESVRAQLANPTRLRTNAQLWRTLNEILARGSAFHALRKAEGKAKLDDYERLESPGQMLVPIAKAIGKLIVDADLTRVRACEGHGCSLWFLDQTKAGRRRFCSASACGNRAKVAAFRARQRHGT